MATSRHYSDRCGTHWEMSATALIILGCFLPFSESAAVALTSYTMDQRSDCISAGFLDIPRDQKTIASAPSKDTSTASQVLSCRLQFSPQTPGDTLRLTLDKGSYFEDCDVSLEVQMTNSEKIILGCKSNIASIPVLEAIDGKASLWLSRRQFDDKSYWFQITVTAFRTEANNADGAASSGDIGMIVGITAGVILFLVIAIIICVCCYRKRRNREREQTKNEYNKDVGKNSLSVNAGHGYENNMSKISYDDSFKKSPGSDKKLLNKMYDEGNDKPKSALERFGHPTSNKKQPNWERRETHTLKGESNSGAHLEERELGKKTDIPAPKVAGNMTTNLQNSTKSPVLAALHNNPKFRRSFHENEIDAEERVRRISDHSSVTSTSADSESVTLKKPRLPPVPKSPPRSPSPQRRGEKIAGIRARPSSSSSSEMARLEEDWKEREKKSRRENHDKYKKPTSAERKKSDRKFKEEKDKHKYNSDESDDSRRDTRDDKKLRRKYESQEEDRKRKIDEKDVRHKKEKTPSVLQDDDDRSQRTDRDGEYEGRFKKSASGRKPKSKGQRMGRSKSTGNALEEIDSNYQRTRSKSPSSVRSLILAEDDDDELDSNYMPFKRSGSKVSLYASRSSLYGRRRKNSMGETISMSSYMHDDVDSRMGDFDKTRLSHKEKERLFKSTGDLEVSSSSAMILRDCATQTGSSKEVYVYGRKTVIKRREGKLYSRGTQTRFGIERRDSTGSARSGKSAKSGRSTRSDHLKSRSKSQESLRRGKGSKSRDYSDDEMSERSKSKSRSRNHSGNQDRHPRYSDDDDDDDRSKRKRKENRSRDKDTSSDSYNPKQKSKPNPKPRKFLNTTNSDVSDSDDDKSTVISSVAASSIHPVNQQIAHAPQFIPAGYPAAYPQPAFAYVPSAPGGPPVMLPLTSVPHAAVIPHQKPAIAQKPNVSKWDQLVNLTEGMKKRRHQMGESLDSESVLSSTWSQPAMHGGQPQVYYSPSQGVPNPDSTFDSTYYTNYTSRDSNV